MTKTQVFMKQLLDLAKRTSRWGVNPDDEEELIIGDAVAMEMEPVDSIWIHFLAIRALDPGGGKGSLVMQQVMKLVDSCGVYLVGKIRPYDTKKVSVKKLRKWYRKFGCKPLNSKNVDGLWIRIPKNRPYMRPNLTKIMRYRINRGYSFDDYTTMQKRDSILTIAILLLLGYLIRYKL